MSSDRCGSGGFTGRTGPARRRDRACVARGAAARPAGLARVLARVLALVLVLVLVLVCGMALGFAPQPATAAGLLPEPAVPPPAVPGTPAPALLQALVQHSRLPLPLDGGRLGGAGGALWRQLAAASSHVVLGEQHGNAGIAHLAQAMWGDLAAAGWRHAALEIDPFVADALQRARRQGGTSAWTHFLAARGGATAVPFVGWQEEFELAAAVPQVWGLDQVFIGSAGWLLRDLMTTSHHGLQPASRAAVQAFVAEAAQQADWLGRVDPARLQAAAAATRAGSPARTLLQALHHSALIYGPFTGEGRGEATTANQRREQAMKRVFATRHRQAEAGERRPPRVFVKVGAYHAMRGATPTGVQGLGGFVSEWAAARDHAVLTVLVLCGPGSQAAVHGGEPQPCDGLVQDGGDWQFLREHLDARVPTLFDLRSWRLRPRRLQALPAEVQRVVGSFDLLVLVPAALAATPLR